MMWDDVPFEERARFMRNNVMELSRDIAQGFTPADCRGFESFRRLLLEIYAAPDAFPGEDPLERFHDLSYSTQLFFSALATAGEAAENGEALYVTKKDFKQAYKKPGLAPFAVLPSFGVRFAFTKKGQPVDSFGACDAFLVDFPRGEGIAAALKHMAAHYAGVDHKREYAEALVMLGKADFDRLALGRPALREEIDPLRPDILRSAGASASLYEELIRQGQSLGFTSQCYLQRYANPTWNVNLYEGRKLRIKSVWCESRNYIHLPVPFDQAEPVIQNRRQYHPAVRAAIERFGCVNCGRCQAGKPVNFKKIDHITICTGHGESSTIFMELKSPQELNSLLEIIRSL